MKKKYVYKKKIKKYNIIIKIYSIIQIRTARNETIKLNALLIPFE